MIDFEWEEDYDLGEPEGALHIQSVEEPVRTVFDSGTVLYRNSKGEFHRTDGPAVEWPDVTTEWWFNGLKHRSDGPAIEGANGDRYWYVNGLLHRTDGPAIEYADGTKEWWLNGLPHRADGPAIEWDDGAREWWICGVRREDLEGKE